MSIVRALQNLTFTRSYTTAKWLNPSKFKSILHDVPPKPTNQWQIFVRENMKKQKHEEGKYSFKDVIQDLSRKWKTLPENEKEIYLNKFNKEMESHQIKLEAALNKATPKEIKQENALRKMYNIAPIKDPKHPKRAKNAFLFYLEHLRSTNDPLVINKEPRSTLKNASEAFKNLSESEVAIYNKKAESAKEQYRKELQAYEESTH